MHGRYRVKPRFAVFLLVFVFILSLCVRMTVSAFSSKAIAQQTTLQERYKELCTEIASLQEEINYSQTDEYIENTARKELGMMKEGEIRYVSSGS